MACFSVRNAAFISDVSSASTTAGGRRLLPGSVVPVKSLVISSSDRRDSYGSLVLQAAQLLGPPTRFDASKLKVIFTGEELVKPPPFTIPRAYTLTHCDFTANLTLAISNSTFIDKVLKAVVHGDSSLFSEHPELLEAVVWVYFHSKLETYNRVECWGPLKDATMRTYDNRPDDFHTTVFDSVRNLASPRAVFHALVAFLL